jgi:hypothetical protein
MRRKGKYISREEAVERIMKSQGISAEEASLWLAKWVSIGEIRLKPGYEDVRAAAEEHVRRNTQ